VRVVDLRKMSAGETTAGRWLVLALHIVVTSSVNFFKSRGLRVTLIRGRLTAASVPW
jgi:hypothetical protein